MRENSHLRHRRVVVASLLAVAVVGGGGAAVLAAQSEDPCDRLRALDDAQFETFEEQQRAQAEATAACYQEENQRNMQGGFSRRLPPGG